MPIPWGVPNYQQNPADAIVELLDYWLQAQTPAEKQECADRWVAVNEYITQQQMLPQLQAQQAQIDELKKQSQQWQISQSFSTNTRGNMAGPVGTARVPPANAAEIDANQGQGQDQNG